MICPLFVFIRPMVLSQLNGSDSVQRVNGIFGGDTDGNNKLPILQAATKVLSKSKSCKILPKPTACVSGTM